jgi:hypothetical protein
VRPDSVSFYLNYYIHPADSGAFLLKLNNADSVVALDLHIITGSSGGSFQRFSFPVNYLSGLSPDSVTLVFVNFNPFGSGMLPAGIDTNYMIIDDVSFIPNIQQPCNGNVENIFDFPVNRLKQWYYSHNYFVDPTDFDGSQIVRQVINIPPDDYAAELRNIAQNPGGVYSPSITTSSVNKDIAGGTSGGFPVSRRYTHVNGFIKFFPELNDTLQIEVIFAKNGEQCGRAFLRQADSLAEFTPFDAEILYFNDTVIPDSATFFIRCISMPQNGLASAFFDKFSFDGLWGVLPDVVVNNPENEIQTTELRIYPNPSKNTFTAELSNAEFKTASATIFDINGRILQQTDFPAGQPRVNVDVSGFNAGIYFVQVRADQAVYTKKMVVVK